MATKIITVLEDDLDGTAADETVNFQLDGVAYNIDLTTAHAEELRAVLRPYVQNGRKHRKITAGRRRTEARSYSPTTRPTSV